MGSAPSESKTLTLVRRAATWVPRDRVPTESRVSAATGPLVVVLLGESAVRLLLLPLRILRPSAAAAERRSEPDET